MFSSIQHVIRTFTKRERIAFVAAAVVAGGSAIALVTIAIHDRSIVIPVVGGTYVEGAVGQPSIINPIISQNPIDQDLSALLYAPLTDLAASIVTGDKGQSYTVKLKEDLVWSDGMPLTSDDVVFTVQTIQNPDAHSPLARSFDGVTIERESELQVKFSLPAPYVFFRDNLMRLAPIPKHLVSTIPVQNLKLSQYNLQPVGDGPYVFDSFSTRKDGFITRYNLSANPRYAGQSPFIEHFAFQFYDQESSRADAFRRQEIDGFGSTFAPSLESSDAARATTDEVPMPRYYAIFMNQLNNPALKNDALRRALSEAIDRSALVGETMGGAGTALTVPAFPELAPIADSTTGETDAAATSTATTTPAVSVPDYDPSDAARLLASVPNADSLKFTLVVPNVPELVSVGNAVKDMWAKIGLTNITILPLEPDDLVNNVVKSRNYELLLFGNVLENPADLFPFWHSSERFYPGLNLALYQNQKADALMETIRQSSTPLTRPALLGKAATLIAADDPAVFLFSLPYFYVHSERLEGFNPHLIVTPSDRFRDIVQWSVARVRILK